MLGGHLDDMEADWSKPIVSIRFVTCHNTEFVMPAHNAAWALSCDL